MIFAVYEQLVVAAYLRSHQGAADLSASHLARWADGCYGLLAMSVWAGRARDNVAYSADAPGHSIRAAHARRRLT